MKNTNHTEINWDIAIKVVTNEATMEEKHQLESWIMQSESNKKEWELIKQGLIESDKALTEQSIDTDKAWINIKNGIYKHKQIRMHKRTFVVSMAAVILVLIGIFNYYKITPEDQVITSNQNTLLSQMLSDGSKIDININSKVIVPASFNKGQRNLSLSGEAFFNITRNTESPFTINVGKVKVKVLGTSFNIKENNQSTEIIVASGKVLVSAENGDELILLKGDRAIYLNNKASLLKSTNQNKNYLAWKTQELVFKNTRLSEAILLIEDIYNVKVEFTDDFDTTNLYLSATFDKNTVDFITDVIAKTYNTKVSYKKL